MQELQRHTPRHMLLLGLCCGLLYLASFLGLFHGLSNGLYDLSFRLRGSQPPTERVVIVAIDEESLAKLGRWPIARRHYADLLDRLPQAAAVGFDLIFTEPSSDDNLFAQAVSRHGRVAMAAYLDRWQRINLPVDKLPSQAIGHIHLEQEIDGISRQVFHHISFQKTTLPSLAKAVAGLAGLAPQQTAARPSASMNEILQIDPMRINWYGPPGTIHQIPLARVLDNTAPTDFFKDKIVLVGLTAPGLHSAILTPFGQERTRMSAVEANAQIVANLLDNEPITVLPGWLANLLCLGLALISYRLFATTSYGRATLLWCLTVILGSALLFGSFMAARLWINPELFYPAMLVILALAYVRHLETINAGYLQAKNDWQNTFDTINDPITIHDRQCSLVRCNRAAWEMGPPLMQTLQERCKSFVTAHKNSSSGPIPKLTMEEVFHPELEKYLEHTILPRMDQKDRLAGLVQVVRDITERKKAEEEQRSLQAQLIQAQKMEALGRFSGGIAHDFNNILTAILGFSEISLWKLDKEDPIRSNLEAIYSTGEKAAGLTRQLLAFSRNQVLEMQLVNLNQTVENLSKMLGRFIGEDINLEITTGQQIPAILADQGQIEQILMNLTINARDAMPAGGRLLIETDQVLLDENYISSHGDGQPGVHVVLSVSDSGEGMDQETREQIFEPFFTTKCEGKGTGLGLATVHGIVKQHNGLIYVYSEPDQGTTFKVYFPAVEYDRQEGVVSKPVTMAQGSETILVVEDEEFIRRIISDTLQPLGYTVLEAASGEEGLEIIRERGEEIHLLLTDVVMSGMNGRELAEQATNLCPALKVVFMSGYTDEIISRHGVLEHGVHFLSKPLIPTEVVQRLREVLDT